MSVNHAIILAGGKGERLRPYTDDRPKPMIPVLGNPLLAYQLRWLRHFGINRVTLCCGYLHEVIRSYFGNGTKYGVTIDYVLEQEPLGRGGAIRHAIEENGIRQPVLAMNGDMITNLDIDRFIAFHRKYDPGATLVSVPFKSPYGIVEVGEGAAVLGFQEKPELPFWINAGIYIMEPKMFSLLPEKGDHEVETFPKLCESGELRTFQTRAFWRSIDTVKDLSDTRSEFEEFVFGNLMNFAVK
jgi:NDP-sugar pyrophosphorylase family protein